ncbi:hypothetical protein IWZ01DRAFT_21709 [Phyllosticta capitalensis]
MQTSSQQMATGPRLPEVPYWAALEPALPRELQGQPCCICLEHPPGVRDPKAPPGTHLILRIRQCNHVFGRECLLELYDSDVSMHRCPKCRQAFRPPRTLVYDPTEDVIVLGEGNWAMNVPGQPGIRKTKRDLAASASEEESFYDLDFYDRANEVRLERRLLLNPFYVSGNYGWLRGQVYDGMEDHRRIEYDEDHETPSELETKMLHEFASQSADKDEHCAKDLERVQHQYLTVRYPHMERNLYSLAKRMCLLDGDHYEFPPQGSSHFQSLERVLQQTNRWFQSNQGRFFQFKTLTETLRKDMDWNWRLTSQYSRDERIPPAIEKILDHLVRGTAMVRMFREMDAFGRLA